MTDKKEEITIKQLKEAFNDIHTEPQNIKILDCGCKFVGLTWYLCKEHYNDAQEVYKELFLKNCCKGTTKEAKIKKLYGISVIETTLSDLLKEEKE